MEIIQPEQEDNGGHYHLHLHHGEAHHIFLSQKLLQEFMVNYWAASEHNNLDWVKHN